MPSGRSPPPGFGIITRRTGAGRYVFVISSCLRPASHASSPAAAITAKLSPSTPGAPPLPASPFHRAVPITPADQMGARVDCFPICAAFPVSLAGRHPHLHFRGLLRLYSHYGPLDCSTAQGDLCHEASV